MIKKIFLMLLISIMAINLKASELNLGIGVGSLYYPDYIGSKTSHVLTVPLPYIDYKSETLNIDEDGINKKLFGLKDLELDISISGSLPSNSKDNKLRKGMPDLQFTFEVGPKLLYKFYEKDNYIFSLVLPVRAVFATNLKELNGEGFRLSPTFRADYNKNNFEITYKSIFNFADSKYHNYFYGVEKKHVTINRPEYHAKSGYSSFENRVGMTYKHNKMLYGAYASYHMLQGATYLDSPLVETKSAFFTGISATYIFYTD